MKIYVGNISYNMTEQDLRQEFESFGSVDTVSVVTDRDTGRPRGFAFVEMSEDSEARDAIAAINGKSIMERTLVVNEARPRNDNRGGGGGGFGGGRERRY